MTALHLLILVEDDQPKKELLGPLLTLFVQRGDLLARSIIKTLPRRWVIEHIEEYADKLLESADEEQYRALVGLYKELDRSLISRVVSRAFVGSGRWPDKTIFMLEVRHTGTDRARGAWADDRAPAPSPQAGRGAGEGAQPPRRFLMSSSRALRESANLRTPSSWSCRVTSS